MWLNTIITARLPVYTCPNAVPFCSPLQEAFQEEAKNQLAALGQSPSASQQRKRHANLRDRVQGLWTRARLFEKAIAIFEGLQKCAVFSMCNLLDEMMCVYLITMMMAQARFECIFVGSDKSTALVCRMA